MLIILPPKQKLERMRPGVARQPVQLNNSIGATENNFKPPILPRQKRVRLGLGIRP